MCIFLYISHLTKLYKLYKNIQNKNILYESLFYSRHKNIGVIIALVLVLWLEFTLVVLFQLRYNTVQLLVQTLNTIPERAFV